MWSREGRGVAGELGLESSWRSESSSECGAVKEKEAAEPGVGLGFGQGGEAETVAMESEDSGEI